MGEPNLQLLSFLAITFDVKTFVETGSAHGETTEKALNIFPFVNTVELDDVLFAETFAKVGKRASCYHIKSVDALRVILGKMYDLPIVYWLDAHYSGPPTAGFTEQCPLLGELEVINSRSGNNDFILIDDAHVFFSPVLISKVNEHKIEQWPDIQTIFAKLNKKDRYTVILHSYRCVLHEKPGGIVFPEDVIVSVPSSAKEQLFNWYLNLELEGLA
jgi:hypothetical protein